jgi:hypothetical protein
MDAELARLIRSCCDYPASLRRSPDDDWLAPQLRVVELLHGGVEGVEVSVDDRAAHGKMIPGAPSFADSVVSEDVQEDESGEP